jgi:hypothetical protein
LNGKPVLGVHFGALRRSVYEAACGLCQALGVKPLFVDSLPAALTRAVVRIAPSRVPEFQPETQTALVLYLDIEQIQISVLVRGSPVLFRSIYLTDPASRGSFMLERRKMDLDATLDFVRRQLGLGGVDRLLIAGGEGIDREQLSNWASSLSEELGVKASLLDLGRGGPAASPTTGGSPWADLVCLGLALRNAPGAGPSKDLDLSASFKHLSSKRGYLKKAWGATAALALALGALGAQRAMGIRSLQGKLEAVRQHTGGHAAQLSGKNAVQIKQMVSDMSAQAALLASLTDPQRRLLLAPILESLARNTPPEAWLESVGFKSAPPRLDSGLGAGPDGGRLEAALAWRGRVRPLGAQKDFEVVNQFFRTLKEARALSGPFPTSDLSVKRDEARSRQGEAAPVTFTMEFKTAYGTKP